jgi:hypothetical protein
LCEDAKVDGVRMLTTARKPTGYFNTQLYSTGQRIV